ncbi:hypothetical protein AVEN_272460-1 [Araneus ventricosus]|uniref:CRAL-TRIO domain-containing protein n=1 Tax=Araneus ventricosus TaxID=182803 RepID=A0A4Y2RWA3_ARAVE|nr:hypothetical protein AVEN_272460-1 [Araneus ventricosus]
MESAKAIIVGNKVYRPFLDDTLTADDLRVAKEELNETQETRETCLRLLKEMLRDDEFLLRFLRCRKFDCKKAFKMVREHYKFRKMNPGLFLSPTALEEALRMCIFNFLPHRDHKGRVVFVIRFDRWDADKIPYTDFVAAGNLVAEYASTNNSLTQIHGYVGIWDYAGFNFKHFRLICSPQNGLILANLMQDRFPGRFKLAYCIHCHPLVKTTWNLLKTFMKEKFRQRDVTTRQFYSLVLAFCRLVDAVQLYELAFHWEAVLSKWEVLDPTQTDHMGAFSSVFLWEFI